MKLHYRGNSYESHPQRIETYDTGITAKYRGQTYQVRRPLARTGSQPLMNLKYRGIVYTIYTIDQDPASKSRLQPSSVEQISRSIYSMRR